MITWDDDERDSRLSEFVEDVIYEIYDFQRYLAPEKEVSSVNDKAGPVFDGVGKDAAEVAEKIGASPPAFYSRPDGEIEAEMRIGEKEESE